MADLNQFCIHDVSDEDCYKCMKYGIIWHCPSNCPEFEDWYSRKEEAAEVLKQMQEG